MTTRWDTESGRRRSAVVGLVTAAVFAVIGSVPGVAMGPTPGPSSEEAAGCSTGWSEQQLAKPWTSLTAVSEVGRGLWAAGFTKRARGIRRPIVVRRTADGWTSVRLPGVARETGLFDLVQARNGLVWAVGYESDDLVYRPYLLRGGAGGMARVGTPSFGSAGASLIAVTQGAGGVVTVGFRVGPRGEVPMIVRRTRLGWSVKRIAVPRSGSLMAVERVGVRTWAAGWQTTGSGVRPLVLASRGSRWVRVDGPAGDGAILDLAADRSGGTWAAGYTLVTGRQRPAVWRHDGGGWSALPSLPFDHPLAFLTGIDTTAEGVVVAGTAWQRSTSRWVGVAARWDGQRWSPAPQVSEGADVLLHDLAVNGDRALPTVAGQSGQRSLLLTWCGAASDPGVAPRGTRRSVTAGSLQRPGRGLPRIAISPVSASVVARDVTRQVGLAESTQTHGGLVADLDRNGWPDMFISRHGGPAKLMLNVRGRFRAPTGSPFPPNDRHSCTEADADGDGRLDIYCAMGADRGAGFKTNELWLRGNDGTYADDAVGSGIADPFGRGRFATFFDLDHDRSPDLFIANKVPRTDGLPGPSVLYARPGGGAYRARSTAGFDASMGAECLHPADMDGDGWEDLILCRKNLNRAGSYGVVWLRNERGTLRDRTSWLGLTRRVTMDALPVDIDRDGRLDLVEVTPGRLLVHLRRGSRFVTSSQASLSAGAAVAAGDVDGDRDPDLYVLQGRLGRNTPDRVFLTGRGGRSLRSIGVPGTTAGGADAVLAIDHDRNGLSDFLVLNGAHGAGPIKLIAFFRR